MLYQNAQCQKKDKKSLRKLVEMMNIMYFMTTLRAQQQRTEKKWR